MDVAKIKTEELIVAFQKLGEAHRSIKEFIKINRKELNKPSMTKVLELSQTIGTHQQNMIDFAFDSFFKKKGKR